MKRTAIAFAAAAALALSLGLTACGGSSSGSAASASASGSASAEASASAAASASSAAAELDWEGVLKVVEEACPIDVATQATDVKVSAAKDGLSTVTFGSEFGDFSYTVDVKTGEIVEKVEPEVDAAAVAAADPVEAAINACTATIDGYNGGAENIEVKISASDGSQKVEVLFDYDGKSYDLVYDTATGEVTEK